MRKVKTFNRLFVENADTISEERTKKKNKPIPCMFQDTFISTCGEIYSLAKEKYLNRTMEFTKWCFENCVQSTDGNFCLKHLDKGKQENWKTLDYWYKFWKNESKK